MGCSHSFQTWKVLPSVALSLLLVLHSGAKAWAEELSRLTESLSEAMTKSRNTSGILKASEALVEVAQSQSQSSRASLFPKLTLDGTYFYQTYVPNLNVGAFFGVGGNGSQIQFGTNNNYIVGPTLSYVLFDAGQSRKNWKSFEKNAEAKSEDRKTTLKQLELNTRLAYFRVQFDLRQLVLTTNSLKLALAQYKDINNRFRAGGASKLDQITAKQEVLNYQLRYRQAQTSAATDLRTLLALTGEENAYDGSRPIPKELVQSLPDGVEKPSLVVQLDPLEEIHQSLVKSNAEKSLTPPGAQHPQVRSLEAAAETARLAAESHSAALWPRVQLSAKSVVQYPFVPIIQTVNQNVFTVNVSMPIFEADQTRNLAAARGREAIAAEFQKDQKLTDLNRDWKISQDQLESLKAQLKVAAESVMQAREVEQLTYKSYQAGKVNILDVQSSNLKLLESEVNLAQIQFNTLNQIAQLEFLSETKVQ